MAATRRLSAILAADVAGYSRLMEADEEGTLERLKAIRRELFDRKVAEHHGRIVSVSGDGLLVEFASVVDALRCAAEVQRGMLDRDRGLADDQRIKFRIGINLGDVIVDGGDLFGDGVNIAARLEGLAEPGGICVSHTVRDQIRDSLADALEDMGEQSVHNIARPVRAYALRADTVAALPAAILPPPTARRPAGRRRGALAVAAGLSAAALAATAWMAWDGMLRPATTVAPAPPAPIASAPPGASASPAAAAPRLSIVVLPFDNLSHDPDQDYLADGITEDLTTDLSRVADSFVIARNTAFTYKGRPVEAKQIGRELGVRYVLEGSVRRSGDQVRINVELVDAETGAQLWAERFDREAAALLGLETEITGRIARAVRSRMLQAEAARLTERPQALDYILRGRAALTKSVSQTASDEAINDFEQALQLDPGAVEAEVGLASALVSRVLDEFTPAPATDLDRAEELLARALAAAPDLAWGHYVRGQLLRAQWRCDAAIPEYESAIALDRNLAPAYAWLGWCRFLTGEVDKVIPLEEQAIRLSPQDRAIAGWYGRIGMAHLLQGRTDEAIRWLEKARGAYAARPSGPVYVHAWLASAYALKGEAGRASVELQEAWKDGFHRTMAGFDKDPWYTNPTTRKLAEATYFAGLRKAGMPGE